MRNMIKALNIFLKYKDVAYPFAAEHDNLYLNVIDPKIVSDEDLNELAALGWYVDSDVAREIDVFVFFC